VTAPTVRTPRGQISLLWLLVAASAVTAISLGIRSTFGLFLTPMVDALQTDRAGFALAIALQNLIWGLGQPVAGAIADRFGSAKVLAVGGVLYAVGVFGMSRASTTTELYLSGGLVVGIAMAAASFAVVLAAVGKLAPPERRTWAMGIATAAGSLGQFVLVPAAGRLEGAFEWRTALATLGAIALVVVAVAPMLRKRPDHAPGTATGTGERAGATPAAASAPEPLGRVVARAVRHRPYLLLCAGFFVCGFHVTFIGTHLPAYLRDLDLGASAGTQAIALIGLFNVVGAFGAGLLAGRFRPTYLLSFIYGARALAIVGLLVLPHTQLVALLFGAVMGLLWLSTVPLTSAIVVGQFGVANAGTLFGGVFLAHQLGAFVGVFYGGKLADATGSYVAVWWIAVALGVFAAIIHLFISDQPAAAAPERIRRRVPGLRPAAGMASVVAIASVSATGAALVEPGPSPDPPPLHCEVPLLR
jgi:MFS family permease